ncbi:PREDICTED: uncharacterized protein LOC107170818 [Diuraphis noxia]|uniref:uncharacterized protein LOC107170818 n=1 Tax=Diuraphis noxia TaxID=143948 RepID=UPI00076389D9|nr:PREDICTED: uncharacterized protein LOC107170818 [Diuraphis noxia]
MVNVLVKEVETRFGSIELIALYAEATILDPRFKSYGFLHQHAYNEGKKSLISKATTIRIANSTNKINTLPNENCSDSIWNDFDSEVNTLVQSSNPTSAFIVELDKYLQEPLLPRNEDVLVWWKQYQYVYPRLFQIVKKRFCIMGTSVPCERIFFKAGQTITKKEVEYQVQSLRKLSF